MAKKKTQFKKGNAGKPKGATNKTTRTAKELVTDLVSAGMETAIIKLNQIEDPKEYLHTLAKFIAYVVPKKAENDHTLSGEPFNLKDLISFKD